MSEEKKDGCCSSEKSGCGCCGGAKKLVIGLIAGALLFASGVMFAKSSCMMGGSKVCPISGKPMNQ